MSNLNELADDLEATKTDTEDPIAAIHDVNVDRRDDSPAQPDPNEGLVLHLERRSGKPMTAWVSKPEKWLGDEQMVLLLEYLNLQPGDLRDVDNVIDKEVPIRKDSTDGWVIDWKTIEHSVRGDA